MTSNRAYEHHLPLLRRGDRVAVITPSGPADPTRLADGIDTLRSWGVEPVVGHGVNTGNAMTAGSDSERAADLQWALTSPDIAAVFCGRGGYGLIRILDLIDWNAVAASATKPVIGFSDITALHAALATRVGWASILGVHVAGGLSGSPAQEQSSQTLRTLLFTGELPNLLSTGARVMRTGNIDAHPLRGGNLAMLAAMSGSPEGEPPDSPFVAVLEDVNEAPYRVDRMLTQLLRSGWFDNAAGVLCGSWEGCHGRSSTDPEASETPQTELEAVLDERLSDVSGPLVLDLPFGHGAIHLPVPLGIPVDLDTSLRTLTFFGNEQR